jgi:hypothetical protein
MTSDGGFGVIITPEYKKNIFFEGGVLDVPGLL